MSDIPWRVWVRDTLVASATFTDRLPAESFFAGGSLEGPPDNRPFAVLRMEPEGRGPFKGISVARGSLWVHDEPGTYLTIDQILQVSRDILCGEGAIEGQRIAANGGIIVWRGFSGDLANTDYGTILRTSTFDLYGKDGGS